MIIQQVYCKRSGKECSGGQRFCLVCNHQFCQFHFGVVAETRCLNCIKRLMAIEDATIKVFNDISHLSSGLPDRFYPESLLKEIRKYQEIVRAEL